jgi:organic radical activating enzyme
VIKHREIAFNIIYGYRCNYSCVGCCNGSNYVKNTKYDPDLAEILLAIEKLPEYIEIDSQGMITLLGGEPFVYWEERIKPIAIKCRESFPDAKINIFSNGHTAYKFTQDIINFIDKYNLNITISNHLKGDMQSTLGTQWSNNIAKFLNHDVIIKIHNEHYHIKDNTNANIYFYHSDTWLSWYKTTNLGEIKPYNSDSAEDSMKYGCASGSLCTAMFGSKIYKCGSIAMLKGLLEQKKQIDDVDWKQYLDYPAFDVLQNNISNFNYHVVNYNKPVQYCTMCNNMPDNVMLWTNRTKDMIIPSKTL